MMKLKRYLKKLASLALLLVFSYSFTLLSGCNFNFEPTYKYEDISSTITKIAQEEYKIDVVTNIFEDTLWLYIPLERIFKEKFNPEDPFEEESLNKIRNVMTVMSRVVLSADKKPGFYVMVISDIKNLGADYTLIGQVLDIDKSNSGYIHWSDMDKRYIKSFVFNPQAMGDKEGKHLQFYNVTLKDFMTNQILQRIQTKVNQIDKDSKIYTLKAAFDGNHFLMRYNISIKNQAVQPVDLHQQILEIIAFVIRNYEFEDFKYVDITDNYTNTKHIVTKQQLKKIK